MLESNIKPQKFHFLLIRFTLVCFVLFWVFSLFTSFICCFFVFLLLLFFFFSFFFFFYSKCTQQFIDELNDLQTDIKSQPDYEHFDLFIVDCMQLKEDLVKALNSCALLLTKFVVDEHKAVNAM